MRCDFRSKSKIFLAFAGRCLQKQIFGHVLRNCFIFKVKELVIVD